MSDLKIAFEKLGGVVLAFYLVAPPVQAFYDGFETYTNGASFEVATNGWQASTNVVQVQTNVVDAGQGTNAVIMPSAAFLTNTVMSDVNTQLFLWTDFRMLPSLGQAPSVGSFTSASDSVRIYFDTSGYVGIDSNRTWVICVSNVLGGAVSTRISNQWVRISEYVDYTHSNAAVFLNGELLCANIPLPGAVATNYNRVLWNCQDTTGYLDSVSISTNWPALATNSLSDLDNDGMLDVQEIQVYGNMTNYHRLNIMVVSTNLTLGVPGGGTVTPETNVAFTVMPGTGTNITATAAAGYNVWDILTNGVSVGAAYRYSGQVDFSFSPIWTDTTVTIQFATNYVVTPLVVGGAGGTITPASPVEAFPTTNLVFAITSSPAYVVSAITTNGVSAGSFAGLKTAFVPVGNILTDVTLAVTFSYTSNRTVGASGDYTTIGSAVAEALAGDTLMVSNGTYVLTSPVVITNAISLVGDVNNPASITVVAPTGGVDLDCFQVRTNGVVIEGFLMTGATNGPAGQVGSLNAGIMVGNDVSSNQMAAVGVLTNLGNGVFLYNGFSNCTHGVYVMGATNCLIAQSEFLGNTTGVWASVSTDARSNWWDAAEGPGPVGPGAGDKVSSNVLYMPWWVDAARSAHVIYSASGLQAALDLASAGDVIWTTNGLYTGNIQIDQAVSFLTGFTLNGQMAFNANVTLSAAYTCTNVTVATGVTVTEASGASLTSTNLTISGTGKIEVAAGATLSANDYSVSGPYTADLYWATLKASTLDFADDFEGYAMGTPLSALGLYGWSAAYSDVIVQTNFAASGAKAVILPPATELDNTVDTSCNKIWTDYRWLPVLGTPPTDTAASNQSIRLCFDTNGWLAVDTTNGWIVCSTNFMGGAAPKASNVWMRVSVFQDYTTNQQAVFVNGELVLQQLPFVGTNATAYTQFRYLNTGVESNDFMDAVSIGTSLPVGLVNMPNSDLDGDGMADALEIQHFGSTFVPWIKGSIFTIR